MVFLFVFFGFFLCFSLYIKRFSNPYKLTFIFGKKGAGKSCYMVRQMLRYRKRGWTVYTDMDDIKLDGVRIFNPDDLDSFTPEPHSALFLDEVGIRYDNRNFKNFPSGVRDWYKFQRKYKCTVFMNSQSYDVDLKIRSLCDDMILQTSLMGCISISRPIVRKITLTEPDGNSESRIADKLQFAPFWKWKFYLMPRYFKYFDSFQAPERPLVSFTVSADDRSSIKSLKAHSVKKAFAILNKKENEDV